MDDKKILNYKYRPEIDGLRAFAVVAVIINHFNKDILPNGYLGVDIFFVISGYVILSSLTGRKNNNFWDFISRFFEKRIKRLVPALLIFVLINSILICLFRFHHTSGSLQTGISSLFGLSNIALFWKSKDYFATSQALNPFTHTWSLGVEGQFYIMFPFLIWFTGYNRQTNQSNKNLFISIVFLFICSLISFIYLYPINQPAAYYLMPTRFWEIATGCLIFLGLRKNSQVSRKLKSASPTFVSLAIILVMFFPKSVAVLSTLLIVFLTALLISCLREDQDLFHLFTNRNIIYIGQRSYSLYLWHWGILAISRWTIGIHWWSIPLQIGLISLASFSSYKWIESPFRKKDWSNKNWKTILKGALAVIFTATNLIALEKPLNVMPSIPMLASAMNVV